MRQAAAALLLVGLAGCAAKPPPQYYTLLPPGSAASSLAVANAAFAIEVLPVNLPPQADQPHIMLRQADGTLAAVYSSRWAAPLGDELRGAIAHVMTRSLGVPDVSGIGASRDMPVWRIQVDVQRFEFQADAQAMIDATWRVRPTTGTEASVLCHSAVRVDPADAGISPLVVAQQQAVAQLAAEIASAVRAQAMKPAKAGANARNLKTLDCRTGPKADA